METLSVTTIFWFLTLGITTGWLTAYLVGDEGITMKSNIVWGGAGAVLIGFVALILDLSGVLIYSFMGTLGILFIANVFHLHHDVDIKGDIDRGVRIKHRNK